CFPLRSTAFHCGTCPRAFVIPAYAGIQHNGGSTLPITHHSLLFLDSRRWTVLGFTQRTQ
ncbi:hypothetical protein KAV67_01580, partial [Candidatus Bipolaricaulota bacterium]|nr:hypothetical protein [Candidatus Bipolaricaulota bacterium]